MKVEVELLLDREDLYTKCYEAYRWAQSGIFKTGSNEWMTMFVDKLQAELKNNIQIVKEEPCV